MRVRPRWIWILPLVVCSLSASAGPPVVWKGFMADFNRTSRELEAQLLAELRARGVEVTTPNAGELAAWKAAMAAVRPVALETGGSGGRALLSALERPRAR